MSDGVLIINIDSTGNIGVLNVQGRANLDGTLTVNRNQDYQPPVGTDLVFMRYSSVFGDFAMIGIGFNYWENGGPVQYDPTRLNTDYELDAVYM